MKLRIGDCVAWKGSETALRTGQYIGMHVAKLRKEKASKKEIAAAVKREAAQGKLVRIWPTKSAAPARRLQKAASAGSCIFVTLSIEHIAKLPSPKEES